MKKPFYKILYVQVLFAIFVGVLLGVFHPELGTKMKPLGDGFIKLIKMIIAPVIFCTVVAGIAGMQDMKKIGRVGGKALLYFEVVSTFALAIGLVVANVVKPGAGFNVDPAHLDTKSIAQYTEKAHSQSTVDFIMNIIPNTFVDAFAKGDILQVLLIAILFGFSLSMMGERGRPVTKLIEDFSHVIFGVVNIVMKVAPIGAFGAMAFTIGKYGLDSLLPLAKLMGSFYLTCFLFVAQATNTDLTLTQELTILFVAMLTSKGASGITGAGFITLAATLAVVPTIPVAGMALILGIDRFMSECRALTNFVGNGVATVVVSKWEKELDTDRMHEVLNGRVAIEDDKSLKEVREAA